MYCIMKKMIMTRFSTVSHLITEIKIQISYMYYSLLTYNQLNHSIPNKALTV